MSEYTNVRLLKTTRDALKEIGSKGQTYDEIIMALIEIGKQGE